MSTKSVQNQDGKVFWKSKTFWVNVISLIAIVVQYFTGWVIPMVAQTAALAIINLILRATTHEKIYWKGIKMLGVIPPILAPVLGGTLIPLAILGGTLTWGNTGCVHDEALKRPVLLITCEYEQYVQHDPKLKQESKNIRRNTAKLLREQVKAGDCSTLTGSTNLTGSTGGDPAKREPAKEEK